jgi:translation initiation factor 2B subunit (eIF-2B alpha/beta/delta family)
MINEATVQLADRLRGLELHAAHSGREVLRVLKQVMDQSQKTKLFDLVEEMRENIRFLFPSLPPYAPPLNNINRILLILEKGLETGGSIVDVKRQIETLYKENSSPQAIRENIVESLMSVLPSQAVVYTHTLSETVLGALLDLHRNKRLKMVIVTESRPNNDGWDTARRLAEHNLTVQLTIDAAMPSAIENAHLMLSGAEIVNPDGSVIGKVGAYPAAVLCQRYGKPVYIVADSNKISNIPWSGFYLSQITPVALGLDFSHLSLSVIGTYFDITPSNLIRAYVTEKGLITSNDIPRLVSGMQVSAWLTQVMNDKRKESMGLSIKGEKQ